MGLTYTGKDHNIDLVLRSLARDAVVDGANYPAARYLELSVAWHADVAVTVAIDLVGERDRRAGDFVRLLGRSQEMRRPAHADLRRRLLLSCLSDDDADVLEAGIQASELWDDSALVPALRVFVDRPPPRASLRYLVDYAADVARVIEAFPTGGREAP